MNNMNKSTQTHHDDTNLLTLIHEGMKVIDSRNEEVGSVEFVQIGNDNPATAEMEAVSPSPDPGNEVNDFFVDVARAFTASETLPDELVRRMELSGYIRIDAGLLRSDRFALAEHIERVYDDTVYLNVTRDRIVAS